MQADIKNIGVIAIELAHGEPPSIPGPTRTAATRLHGYSKQFIEFVTNCLQKEKVRMCVVMYFSYAN